MDNRGPEPVGKAPPTGSIHIESPNKRRVFPVHPLLFGIYPVLSLFARNISQTPIEQTFKSFAIFGAVTFCLWVMLFVAIRSLRKSAIMTSVIVLAFTSYGPLTLLLPHFPGLAIGGLEIGLVVLLLLIVLRAKQLLLDSTSAMNFGALVLVAPSLWTITVYMIHDSHSNKSVSIEARSDSRSNPVPHNGRPHVAIVNPEDPDIYYIILDAYGRADRLKEFFGYDNEPFISALQQRGFYIADKSGANYNQTPLCLSSALNMEYLDAAKQNLTPERLRQMVDDSSVAQFLEKRGYQYVSIWSGLEVSRVTTADISLNDYPDLNAFETQAMNLTPIAAEKRFRNQRYDNHRRRIIGVFDNLSTVARLPGPKFVFAHALAPHPPFVIGQHGESVYPSGPLTLADASWLTAKISKEQYIRGYVAQLQYVNSRVISAIDTILASYKRRPIIIIQGDHGSRMTMDWDSQARTDLREPFANLNAYLVPREVAARLYKSITPVNSFRVIFSSVFASSHPLLPDRSYYSSAENAYEFSDVTKLIPNATGPLEQPTARGLRGGTDTPFSVERAEQ